MYCMFVGFVSLWTYIFILLCLNVCARWRFVFAYTECIYKALLTIFNINSTQHILCTFLLPCVQCCQGYGGRVTGPSKLTVIYNFLSLHNVFFKIGSPLSVCLIVHTFTYAVLLHFSYYHVYLFFNTFRRWQKAV